MSMSRYVLVAAVAFGAGHGLHGVLNPERLQTTQHAQEPGVEPMQRRQEPQTEPSAVERQLDRALQQVASMEVELKTAREDLGVTESPEEGDSGTTQTPAQKLATFRKLMQDPDVQKAMMAENRKVVEDPEMQSQRRASQEMQAKYLFTELFNELGLDDDQRIEFAKLFADGRMTEMQAQMDLQVDLSAGEFNEEEQAAAQERITSIRDLAKQKMADFLGSNFETYEAYAETVSERANLNKIYSSGQPLDDYTKEAILVIMGEEKAAVGEPEPYYGMEFEADVTYQRDSLERTLTRDARILERATSYLTESQHEILEDSLVLQRVQLETNIRYMEAEIERRAKAEDVPEEEEG